MDTARGVLLALALIASLPASAAVITVGASGCDYTTLADAIDAAQSGDELRLRTQTFSGVSVNISTSLTIRGGYAVCGDDFPGLGQHSVIEGTGSSTVVTIGGGVDALIELINVEVTGGGGGLFGGGASVLSGATLRVATVDFHGNVGGSGGAIFVGPDSVLEHSGPVTLRDNLADRGGALYVSSNAVADFTTVGFHPVEISGNVAQDGGGIFVSDQGRLVTDADHALSVSGNQAQAGGGVFGETSAEIELVGDEIRGNTAAIAGGGLFVSGDGSSVSAPTILIDQETDILLNDAGVGGGASFGPGGGYQAEISATFRQNTAVQHGGGMAIDGNGVFDLSWAFFNANVAGTTGGGLHAESPALITSFVSMIGNRAELDGGGAYLSGLASLRVDGQAVFLHNRAGRSGGGLAVHDGSFVESVGGARAIEVLMRENVAETGDGGGLHVLDGFVTLRGALIGVDDLGNQAPLGRGGGGFIQTDLSWSMTNSWVNGNRSRDHGGGLYIAGGADFRVGATLVGSNAPRGGGFPCDPFQLDPGRYCAEVRGNVSEGGVAGIAVVDDGSAVREFAELAIVDNQGGNPAVGFLSDAAGTVLRNVLLARNAGGSAMFVGFQTDLTLEHVSVLYNDRGLVGGGQNTFQVDGSLFWGNGGATGFGAGIGSTVNGSCNLGRSNALPGVIQSSPRFVTTGRGLYRLSDDSPALDACIDDFLSADLDGIARPSGVDSDIGAFEGAWGVSDVLLSDSFETGPLASPRL